MHCTRPNGLLADEIKLRRSFIGMRNLCAGNSSITRSRTKLLLPGTDSFNIIFLKVSRAFREHMADFH